MRVRTLVNPFSVRESIEPVSPEIIFENPNQPLDLEIGTGQGNFFVELCTHSLKRNHLGIELRPKLVAHTNQKLRDRSLKNGRVFYGNIHTSFENLIGPHKLEAVYIFFPDPWEKRRHANRRLMTEVLAGKLTEFLKPNGRIYLQTDVPELLTEFRTVLDKISGLTPLHKEPLCPETLWRSEIGPCFSNRERDAIKEGLSIHRFIYTRSDKMY